MKKSLLLSGILALSSLAFAYSKTYEITLSNATKAGSVQLKAGSYNVKLDGDKAVFTDVNTDKRFTVPVKTENAAKKFDETRVDTTSDGKVDTLKDIQLGGSTTQVDF
jgi:uncharacterized protein YdbL (DUF1318 family)